MPIAAVIQTTPTETPRRVATAPGSSPYAVGTTGVKEIDRDARELPATASALPLIGLIGLVSIGLGFGVMVVRAARHGARALVNSHVRALAVSWQSEHTRPLERCTHAGRFWIILAVLMLLGVIPVLAAQSQLGVWPEAAAWA